MTYYTVNATLHVPAWVEVEADTPEEAQDAALDLGASMFDSHMSSASVEFDVEPAVEVSR